MKTESATFHRLARFIAVSVISFGLNLLVTFAVHEIFRQNEELSFAIALVTVFTFNFFAGRHFIYRATAGDPRKQIVRYVLSSGGFRFAEYVGFLVAHTAFNVHYLAAAVLVLGASFLCKFFFYGNFVFTNDHAQVG